MDAMAPGGPRVLHQPLRRMTGRDPLERGRGASTLELLFDLAFVVAFSLAGGQLAHFIVEGHTWLGLAGYAIVLFGICWAWINFSWFASAFDTDDWVYRLTTFVQMVGVVVLALGIVPMFHSIDPTLHELDDDLFVDNSIIVFGYVIMRVAQIVQWMRVAVQAPELRRTAVAYIVSLAVAQLIWTAMIVLQQPIGWALATGAVALAIELTGPVVGERIRQTPWHAHHIAERYGLLTIIAIGETVVGTVISLEALFEVQGLSIDLLVIAFAGVGLAFAMWWIYFTLPSAAVLQHERDRKAFPWGYGHMVVFGAIAAVGAGLHVAAYAVEDPGHVPALRAVVAVAVPVTAFLVAVVALGVVLVGWEKSRFEVLAMLGSLAAVALAIALAAGGAPLATCLVLITVAPAIQIASDELTGARSRVRALEHFASAHARSTSGPEGGKVVA